MTKYNRDIHHRHSIRLKGYDYSQPGFYFITMCTNNHEHLFGEIENEIMIMNEFGNIAKNEWLETADIRDNVELLEYVIMPNHMHGIIVLNDLIVGAHCNVPLRYHVPTISRRASMVNKSQ